MLGEEEVISAVRSFIIKAAQNRSADIDPLIQVLWTSLRRELELGKVHAIAIRSSNWIEPRWNSRGVAYATGANGRVR